MSNTRYYVFSKTSATQKSLKNAATREEARRFKNQQATPSKFAIYDRWNNEVIR